MDHSKRIYIVPTPFGCLFGLGILASVSFGITTRTPVVAVSGLFMFLLMLLAMIETHVNIRDIQVTLEDCPPFAAGTKGHLTLNLVAAKSAWGVMTYAKEGKGFVDFIRFTPRNFVDCNDQGVKARVELLPRLRGYYPCPGIVIASHFPFGMFRAWKVIQFQAMCAVYPPGAGTLALRTNSVSQLSLDHQNTAVTSTSGQESEFKHHRNWDSGDPTNRIDWKATQRRGQKLLRVFESQQSTPLRSLSWRNTNGGLEQRLAQLSQWVDDAHQENATFRLELPSQVIPFGMGPRQWRKCMTALASFEGTPHNEARDV